MSHPAPLPDLHQAEIDANTLRQLFDDVAAHAEIQEIIPKYSPGHVAESPAITLSEGFELLAGNRVRALQLRYRHDGSIWWDTLSPIAAGRFRIVRIQHDFPVP